MGLILTRQSEEGTRGHLEHSFDASTVIANSISCMLLIYTDVRARVGVTVESLVSGTLAGIC